jgi:hypothetical protein
LFHRGATLLTLAIRADAIRIAVSTLPHKRVGQALVKLRDCDHCSPRVGIGCLIGLFAQALRFVAVFFGISHPRTYHPDIRRRNCL